MTKSACAFQTRYIRYNVDGQGLRYDFFWQRRGKIQFTINFANGAIIRLSFEEFFDVPAQPFAG